MIAAGIMPSHGSFPANIAHRTRVNAQISLRCRINPGSPPPVAAAAAVALAPPAPPLCPSSSLEDEDDDDEEDDSSSSSLAIPFEVPHISGAI